VAWDEFLAAGPRDPPLHPAYPWPVMEIQQHLFGTLHDFVREHPERRRAALARYVPALHSIFESALRRLPATWHSDSSWNDSLREHLRRIESATHFERPAAQHELAEAAGAGDTARLRELLAAGVDPDAYGADGAAAIHRAAAAGHAESIAALLDGGAAIDRQREGLGSSALFDAVANHRDEAALLLIERGADVNLAAWRGTPLQAAAQGNVRPEVLRALAAHGALARAPERPDVVRALQAASRNGYTGIVRAVLDAGVPADARLGRPGWTALMAACASGEDETAALLLEAGADPNAASEDGRTPLSLAREHERTALEALLLRAGARE
jgi:ankyrin repeat protein